MISKCTEKDLRHTKETSFCKLRWIRKQMNIIRQTLIMCTGQRRKTWRYRLICALMAAEGMETPEKDALLNSIWDKKNRAKYSSKKMQRTFKFLQYWNLRRYYFLKFRSKNMRWHGWSLGKKYYVWCNDYRVIQSPTWTTPITKIVTEY